MLDLADRVDLLPTSPVQQQRAWARSCTLRLKAHDSGLVFKAVPPSFSYEPVITRVLSLRYVGKLPEVLAVNVDKAWLLMREFQGTPLTHSRNLDDWKKTLQVFAELQIDISDSTHSLVALGVPDRNVDSLVAQIERLMVDLPPMLDKDEAQTLRRAAKDIRNLCYDLIDIDLPLSLTHGDLWSGNVFIQPNGTPLFYDWSDAAVSHPFFDLPTFLAEIERELPHIAEAQEQLLAAYLDVWTAYRPLPKLRRAYALAEVLSKLHMAIAYQQLIVPGIETAVQWEIENILPTYLRQLMGALRFYTP
jgi:aminoglycoside phosphotransferase